ncbi:MAG: cyclase family protein [Thermoplasmata archaeon]|nr:cyclase family protein [Thermoplasmata archaeon]
MELRDISMPLGAGTPIFPGDPAFVANRIQRVEAGAPYNLTELKLGSHTGTHVDPPLHFLPGQAGAERLDLRTLNGPCRVLHLPRTPRAIGAEELSGVPRGTERLLLRTPNSERWAAGEGFFRDFAALSRPGAELLRSRGVRLVGIDALSIERGGSQGFPVHWLLLGAGVPILEGLRLEGTPAGEYELRCLPLRLVDGDGAPCRAILLSTE